jgi:hypothetical protein
MKNAITNYENTFFLNGAALSGVISVDGSYNIDYKPINVIGQGFLKQVIASVPKGQMSVTRYLVTNDPVFQLTGDGNNYNALALNAGLYYKNKYFAFSTGYLSSFGIKCQVGEVPTIQSSFDVFGDMGSNFNPSGTSAAGMVFVPQVKNITVTCRNSTSNRVKDFSIDFNCPNLPIYALQENNAEIPVEVQNIYPIEVNTSFSLDVDDYQTKQLFDDLSANGITNFAIRVSGTVLNDIPLTISTGGNFEAINSSVLTTLYSFLKSEDATPIFNFSNNNAIITSEQVASSSDDIMSVKLSYKTYLN